MTIDKKRMWLLRECKYKLHHFCDGTPNKSIGKEGSHKAYPPCPNRHKCPFKKISILDGEEK